MADYGRTHQNATNFPLTLHEGNLVAFPVLRPWLAIRRFLEIVALTL
jgi:hypothetical protein